MKIYLVTLSKDFEVEAENEDDARGQAAELFSDEWSQACSLDDVLTIEVEGIKKEQGGETNQQKKVYQAKQEANR